MIYDLIWTAGYLAVVAVLAAFVVRHFRKRGSGSAPTKRCSDSN